MEQICPKCSRAITEGPGRATEDACPGCGQRLSATDGAPPQCADGGDPLLELPARYRVVARLGIGSLAVVYHARDEELRRDVAVKVIHARLLASARAVELFLAESHILAGLDHPGIMPIYDLGQTLDGRYFAVIKLFEGSDLQNRLRQGRPAAAETVEIVAQAAEALDHAHQHGLVHRDVKPGNLLLDGNGRIIVADFDLALRNEDFGTGPAFVGTIPYMSPEQARRESHRVDARSDIYSLGVVLYECLAGRRPFVNSNKDELLELIKTQEPTPPRQLDPAISPEMERICLKAMAKRVADRFETAREMAEDLRNWQGQQARPAASSQNDATEMVTSGKAGPCPVVPRGLRSFKVEDADFFLELLPGPRNRAGLPESVAFWKTYLENTDPEHAGGLGLLYGPSGCGKSSLVKAGLLPRLAPHVVAIYQEATPLQAEPRLLQALRRAFPELSPDLGLAGLLEALRRGKGLPPGKKAVLVLDQFEQWLHANPEEHRAEMVAALRQCDGVHVQCLLLVRDDFWLSVSRFMRDVEVRLVEGQNSGLVDLFDPLHARKVLAAFGRAYGRLPAEASLAPEAEKFLDEAIAGLTEDGKVMPVRLALFAEIVKGKPWTPRTLRDVGGAEGIGVAFLEEALSAPTAPAEHRHHEKAARAVLRALLPDAETSLKGRLHPLDELRAASGYGQDPEAFADLLRILDQGLRLVTPATEEERPGAADRSGQGPRYYQLTHDYLVPALRQWLSNKQRETRRGQAELRLTDAAAFWNNRPEHRRLPRWWEWVNILLFTRSRSWTDAQRRMMRSANRFYTITTTAALLLITTAVLGGESFLRQREEERNNDKADQIVGDMCSFHEHQLAHFQAEAGRFAPWTVPRLRALIANPQSEPDDRLHARLVLLPMDESQMSFLVDAMLTADPRELMEIRAGLRPYQDRLHEGLWQKALDAHLPVERRCRAAAALALFAPDDRRWTEICPVVVGHLVADNPLVLARWIEAFRPVRFRLMAALNEAFRDQHDVQRRVAAVHILQVYASDQPDVLSELVLDAGDLQYALLWPTIRANAGAITDRLTRFLGQAAPADETPVARDKRTRRKALAASTLLYLGRGDALGAMLKELNDPALRSYLIHFYHPTGSDPQALFRSWEAERDRSIHLALLFELGEFDLESLAHAMRVPLVDQLVALYRKDPDPGCHSTLDWLLRYRWGLGEKLAPIDHDLAGPRTTGSRWFVNGRGQHFAVMAGPLEYFRGPPEGARPGLLLEPLLRQQVSRSYAISTRRVTVEQFQRFRKAHPGAVAAANDQVDATAPAVGMSWYEAARYCRWLSEQEGVAEDQMCYPPIDQIKEGMKLPADYLTRTGYRLPTEAEWEFACLTGPRFPRSANDQLLGHYAWHFGSYYKRVTAEDRVKPNGFGVFEVQGAVGSWCQERWTPFPKIATAQPVEDREDPVPVAGSTERVVRGCFGALPAGLSGSEYRSGFKPTERSEHVGLRLVRTVRD